MIESSDQLLVIECLKGNIDAFDKIVEKYQKQIFNAALKMVKDYNDAEDITQNVFIKAFENLDKYSPKYKFFSWIYRMVINESINHINKRKPFEEIGVEVLSHEKAPDEKAEAEVLGHIIQNALMKLSHEYRIVIILKHFEEFSYKDMSYILEIPEKTVKSRLFSARQLLKEILFLQGIVQND